MKKEITASEILTSKNTNYFDQVDIWPTLFHFVADHLNNKLGGATYKSNTLVSVSLAVLAEYCITRSNDILFLPKQKIMSSLLKDWKHKEENHQEPKETAALSHIPIIEITTYLKNLKATSTNYAIETNTIACRLQAIELLEDLNKIAKTLNLSLKTHKTVVESIISAMYDNLDRLSYSFTIPSFSVMKSYIICSNILNDYKRGISLFEISKETLKKLSSDPTKNQSAFFEAAFSYFQLFYWLSMA